MGFSSTGDASVLIWNGNPDCQAAHDWLLEILKNMVDTFLNSEQECSINRVGNLGEFITFNIGKVYQYPNTMPFPANALNPLRGSSLPDIDIVWLRFGATLDDDLAIVQEIKTTGQTVLNYANDLLGDYDKLFAPQGYTLNMRLQDIKNKLEYTYNKPELCQRVSWLGGTSPKTATKIEIVPTLVHDKASDDPQTKMLAIRRSLITKGWAPSAVTSWAIGLSDLEERLKRLSVGRN